MHVSILHKVYTDFAPFNPGADKLALVDQFDLVESAKDCITVQSSTGTVTYCTAELGGAPPNVLDYIFRIHNRVDGRERVCELGLRSLSVGDVVDLDGRSYACERTGWKRLPN